MAFRRKSARPAAYNKDRPIVASAARISIKTDTEATSYRNRVSTARVWQEDAWTYYDRIGEVKFAFNVVGWAMSRIRLYAGVVVDPDAPPVSISDVIDALREAEGSTDEGLADSAHEAIVSAGINLSQAVEARKVWDKAIGGSNVSSIMRRAALNLSVPGEFVLGLRGGEWKVYSNAEFEVVDKDTYRIKTSSADQGELIKRTDMTVGRVWRSHPRYEAEADSSMLGVREDCEELLLLGRVGRASSKSNLNAGILYIADEISVVSRTNPDDGSEESEIEGDPLENELVAAISEPVGDESSGFNIIPLVLRGPSELAEKGIRYIPINRQVDETQLARAERALERILQGLDVPKDIVTGLANVKYSNAVQIDESMYKAHVEPLALMIADAFTDIVLRPVVSAALDDEVASKMVVWYDPSSIDTRTDRSEDANQGYDRHAISAAAWRDAHGFGETDAPGQDELAMRAAIERAAIPPELATALYNRLFPELTGAARESAVGGSEGNSRIPGELQELLDGGGGPSGEQQQDMVKSEPDTQASAPVPGGTQ